MDAEELPDKEIESLQSEYERLGRKAKDRR
jgi:hypothetical protein